MLTASQPPAHAISFLLGDALLGDALLGDALHPKIADRAAKTFFRRGQKPAIPGRHRAWDGARTGAQDLEGTLQDVVSPLSFVRRPRCGRGCCACRLRLFKDRGAGDIESAPASRAQPPAPRGQNTAAQTGGEVGFRRVFRAIGNPPFERRPFSLFGVVL